MSLFTWLLGVSASYVAGQLPRFTSTSELREGLEEVSHQWFGDLPEHLAAPNLLKSLLGSPPPAMEPGQHELAIQQKLADRIVPDESVWYEALLERWYAVRAETEEDSIAFYHEDVETIRPLLQDLSQRLVARCKTVESLFRRHLVESVDQLKSLAQAQNGATIVERPGFLPDCSEPGALPASLTGPPPFRGRETELELLREQLHPQQVGVVAGPAQSGKKRVAGEAIASLDAGLIADRFFRSKLSLLLVRLSGRDGTSFVRALAHALGIEDDASVQDAGWQRDEYLEQSPEGNVGDTVSNLLIRAEESLEGLLRIHRSGLLLVFSNAESSLGPDFDKSLVEFIKGPIFDSGTAIVCLTAKAPGTANIQCAHVLDSLAPTRVVPSEPLWLGALESHEALQILEDAVTDGQDLEDVVWASFERSPSVLARPGAVYRAGRAFSTERSASRLLGRQRLPDRQLFSAVWDAEVEELGPAYKALPGGLTEDELLTIAPYALLSDGPFKGRSPHGGSMQSSATESPGWLKSTDHEWWFSSDGRESIRSQTLSLLSNSKSDIVSISIADGIPQAVAARSSLVSPAGLVSEVGEAVLALDQASVSNSPVERALREAGTALSVGDVLLPQEHSQPSARDGAQSPTLGEEISRLVRASRSDMAPADFADLFAVVTERAAQSTSLFGYQLRALDLVGFGRCRASELFQSYCDTRLRLLDRLAILIEASDPMLRAWTISWTLNTASLAVALSDRRRAQDLLDRAEEHLKRGDHKPLSVTATAEETWLRCRLLSERSSLFVGPDRALPLREAERLAAATLVHVRTSWWASYYLGRVRSLLEVANSDSVRTSVLEDAMGTLNAVYGEPSLWPGSVVLRYAAYLRNAAKADSATATGIDRIRQAVSMVEPMLQWLRSWAARGDARGLLSLARSHHTAARLFYASGDLVASKRAASSAVRLAREHVEGRPTAVGWRLYLRLLDQQDGIEREQINPDLVWGTLGEELTPKLRTAMKRCRDWLDREQGKGEQEAALALWLHRRQWISQGSLLRAARTQADRDQLEWARLTTKKKQDFLRSEHAKREATLNWLKTTYGESASIVTRVAWLAHQYNRSQALIDRGKSYDPEDVLAVFRYGVELHPGSHDMLEELANFKRYIWDLSGACDLYFSIWQNSRSIVQRYRAFLNRAEALVQAIIHDFEVSADPQLRTREFLVESLPQIGRISRHRAFQQRAARLRDRVRIELGGGGIDWVDLERVFALVLKDLGHYPQQVAKHAGIEIGLSAPTDWRTASSAQILKAKPTSVAAIRQFGNLFLRRAELRLGSEPLDDFWRAIVCFDVCSIWERETEDKPRASSRYATGRAILGACSLAGRRDPYDSGRLAWFGTRTHPRTWLDYSSRVLQSALNDSTGVFRTLIHRQLKAYGKLQKTLVPAEGLDPHA